MSEDTFVEFMRATTDFMTHQNTMSHADDADVGGDHRHAH